MNKLLTFFIFIIVTLMSVESSTSNRELKTKKNIFAPAPKAPDATKAPKETKAPDATKAPKPTRAPKAPKVPK